MGKKASATHATARPAPGLFLIELAAFAAIFWADWASYIPLSKTPFLLAAAWLFMAIRGVSWRSAGFNVPRAWPALVLIGVIAGTSLFAFEFFGLQQLILRLTGELPDLHEFDDLVGNLELLAIYLALNLVLAAFGEEMVWRGYALPRVVSLFGGGALAWFAALLLVNVGFGLAHVYQGLPGVIETIVAGFLLGVLYIATGRNLIAPMVAHFTSNTIDFTLIYLGLYPGVGPG
jgi:membrane protease YdiL (CAAX protease family)